MADIEVKICGIEFKNPVMPAAGPNVRSSELIMKAVEGGAGGIVTKTISVKPAKDPRPTIQNAVCRGLMNCETWSETAAEEFIADCRGLKDAGVPLIASIGYRPEEVELLGPLVERELSPDAIEFSTHYVGRSTEPIVEIASRLKAAVSVPIFMKVSPNFPDIEGLAKAVSPHVDGFVAINSFGPVLDFDPETARPYLGSDSGQGWLSGPPILPLALRVVHQITGVSDKPVIGVGGISRGIDAIKFFMAGASAVQVCSAAIRDGHGVYGKIAREIAEWLDAHGYSSIEEIKGLYEKTLKSTARMPRSVRISVDAERCTGCRACVGRCIQGALSVPEKLCVVDLNRCIGCGFCREFCKFDALELKEGQYDR
ncbi:4Fe-4S binding protein [bacterium]|nr:4Fe-4S binding protein [bacterium]